MNWLGCALRSARFHLIATVIWLALVPPTVIWWRESILWVALMSIWANVASHWAAYQAARSEAVLTPDPPKKRARKRAARG